MGKVKTSKKTTGFHPYADSVRTDKKIYQRSKAKNAVSGGTKASCPNIAVAVQGTPYVGVKPVSTSEKGVYGEHVSDAFMVKMGHTKLNGKPTQIGDSPIGNGLDGVFKGNNPPPDYIITETKYGSSELGDTKDGMQMSDNWVANRLKKACDNKQDAKDIEKAMLKPGSVEKWIIHVDDKGVKSVQKLI